MFIFKIPIVERIGTSYDVRNYPLKATKVFIGPSRARFLAYYPFELFLDTYRRSETEVKPRVCPPPKNSKMSRRYLRGNFCHISLGGIRLAKNTFHFILLELLKPAIHLSRNTRKWPQKNKKCVAGYFAFHAPFSVFHISHQGWHSREKSKDFVVYFFTVLIKHEIRMECESV